ncbi:MAG: hypothetical protein NT098_00015 [Candidatus Parcubacteria bacterium]|nr:hypothetical protein [Candidatus Parcubacteria bacterium]
MLNYVISNEQKDLYHEIKKRLCFLMLKSKREILDVVSNRIYLCEDGEWTIISEKNEVTEGVLSLHILLTEYACHLMGGRNLGMMVIKDQEAFDQLFNGFVELMKIDQEFLTGDPYDTNLLV